VDQIAFLTTLEDVIQDRLSNPREGSYTATLAAGGPLKMAQKFGEEAVETVVAAAAEDDARLTSEAADLLYHLIVLLRLRGLSLGDVAAELEQRHSA
jgi:phosphoribosyl-ATP pyrophosphohydrolase